MEAVTASAATDSRQMHDQCCEAGGPERSFAAVFPVGIPAKVTQKIAAEATALVSVPNDQKGPDELLPL